MSEQTSNFLKHEAFLAPMLSQNNLDLYLVRSRILEVLKNFLNIASGTLLDLGCGEKPYKSLIDSQTKIQKYIGIDIENPKYQMHNKPDLFWDGITIPLEDNSVDYVMATELFEHVPELNLVLKEIKRVLKAEGTLFFTVPFLWPLHDAPYDEYRYTPFALERLLKEAGFNNINLRPLGGWHASMAQMLGLWLKRAPMDEQIRAKLTDQFMPFYQELISNDQIPSDLTKGTTMITGITGQATANSV